jgi:hypothetical protein
VPGVVVIAVILILILPALVWVGIGVVAGVLGQALFRHAERSHPGSELIDTNL